MDLGAIQTFIAVADHGGFAKAGRSLRMPRSTVSKQIARLEDDLGVRLFQRTTRSVTLTEPGRVLYEQSSDAVAQLDHASRSARAMRLEPVGTLRVTTVGGIVAKQLGAVLPDFHRRFPAVCLEVEVTDRRVDLVHEGFDVALRAGVLPDSTLVARKIVSSHIMLGASPAYLAEHGTPQSLEELAQHTGVVMGRLPPAILARLGIGHWLKTNDFELIHRLVAAGMGIGTLVWNAAKSTIEAGCLEQVVPDFRFGEGGIYAVYPNRKYVSAATRAFVDYIVEALPPRLPG